MTNSERINSNNALIDEAIAKANALPDDGLSKKMWFGLCATTAGTATKVVTTDSDFAYKEGNMLVVEFAYTNTYTSGTISLNVNSLGAKTVDASNTVTFYGIMCFVYSENTGRFHVLNSGTISANSLPTIPVEKGGTGYTSIVDTTYTTVRYRGSALRSSETNPTQNGTINWTYE